MLVKVRPQRNLCRTPAGKKNLLPTTCYSRLTLIFLVCNPDYNSLINNNNNNNNNNNRRLVT